MCPWSADDGPIEVEVERIDPEPEQPPGRSRSGIGGGFGPILAGLLLDLADFATLSVLPRRLALLVGFGAGWWAARRLGLDLRGRIALACIGAAYCSVGGTEKLPLGTLFALLHKAGLFAGR